MSFYAKGYPRPPREPTLFIRWVDAEAGEVLSESETPPDRVPEGSLAPGQQVMLFGQRWWVVSTNPETEAQWREGGAVLVEIRKVR